MQQPLSRKRFLAIAAATLTVPPLFLSAQTTGVKKAKGDPLAPELVKEWVGKAHSDLARVKELYAQEPQLLNASWDWGGGDFETALEAAGHVGNRDIAEFLLDKGARMNLFCAAMLGKIDIVKAILTAFPDLKNSAGPHGLKLKHHALKGGDPAKPVLDFLIEIEAP